MARTIASQIKTLVSVFRSQKNGKENNARNADPNMYTGRRPTRSESAPKRGMVKIPMAEAMSSGMPLAGSFDRAQSLADSGNTTGSGVILAFGGSGPPQRDYYLGGTQVAFEAIESMRRQLASELGSHGIRVVTLRTGGVPESIPEGVNGREAIVEGIEKEAMLGRAATLEDVGNAAAFAASDRARTMTAATVNISCGALVD